jgi:transcriptional regulator with XRE-family HTH domain
MKNNFVPVIPNGGRIKELREAKGLSTVQFAERSGMSHKIYLEIEDSKPVHPDAIYKIQRLFVELGFKKIARSALVDFKSLKHMSNG